MFSHDESGWQLMDHEAFDIADSKSHYRRWPGLLKADFTVPELAKKLMSAVGLDQLRAYPQLTTPGEWSIRLEGLQVGRIKGEKGHLGVGKDGRDKNGNVTRSRERREWITATGADQPIRFTDASIDPAAAALNAFAAHWIAVSKDEHSEHALESRILRGVIPLSARGTPLKLIRDDQYVNWGSQFPTKWGRTRNARYLDAILRDGQTPWAIEMKVDRGQGEYYRHAVAQAVLYREFIRKAKDLHFWFKQFDLDPTTCEAMVVVPTIKTPKRKERLQLLCNAFQVELVEIPAAYGAWGWTST